jgi:hypothetical protein
MVGPWIVQEIQYSDSLSMDNQPSDRRSSAKLVPTFADRECRVISTTDPYDRILGFLDRIYHALIIKIKMKVIVKFSLYLTN